MHVLTKPFNYLVTCMHYVPYSYWESFVKEKIHMQKYWLNVYLICFSIIKWFRKWLQIKRFSRFMRFVNSFSVNNSQYMVCMCSDCVMYSYTYMCVCVCVCVCVLCVCANHKFIRLKYFGDVCASDVPKQKAK